MATKFRFNLNNQLVDFDDFYVRKDQFQQGNLWVWGRNALAQLGDNTTIHRSSPVQTAAAGFNWKSLSTYDCSFGIKNDGSLWSWGYNDDGQLGDGTILSRSSPVQTVDRANNWLQISGGRAHSAGIKTDGTLWCWGSNFYGALGDNTISSKSSPTQTIALGTNWKQVDTQFAFVIATKKDGTLWTWGDNSYGNLGDNTIIKKSSPIQTIAFGNSWSFASCGQSFASAIKTDGTLWCWGRNIFGQVGDNTSVEKSSPVQITSGGTNWYRIDCGYGHAAGIKTDGTLWLWGYNNNGQLGDNTSTNRSSPVQTISFGNNWKQVACGNNHTAAIKTDNTLWVWGANTNGRLGDNSLVRKSSPIQTIAFGNSWYYVACGQSTAAITFTESGTILVPTTNPPVTLPTPYTIPGLVLYLDASNTSSYPGTGTSWYSLAYIGNTATLNNGPTFNSSNGGNIVFDGVDDSATITRPVQDDFSLCCWFKSTQNAGTATQWYNGRSLMDCEVGGVVNDYGMALGAGKVMFGTGNSDVTIVSSNTYNDGNWHFAVGTRVRSTGALTLYVDGTSVGTTTGSTNSLTSPTTMTMGGIAGSMAVAMAYNTTLSATDVTNLYNYFRSRFGV